MDHDMESMDWDRWNRNFSNAEKFVKHASAEDWGFKIGYTGGSILISRGIGAGLGTLKSAFGPGKQWLRLGPSYSHNLGTKTTYSLRWGASPVNGGKFVKQIGNMSLRSFNQYLRTKSIPINNWRYKDAGHIHLKI